MPEQQLKTLLKQLHETLENTEAADSETREMVARLDEDIHRLLNPDDEADDHESVIEKAQTLQADFAVGHPVAERFLREIIDVLAKVGI